MTIEKLTKSFLEANLSSSTEQTPAGGLSGAQLLEETLRTEAQALAKELAALATAEKPQFVADVRIRIRRRDFRIARLPKKYRKAKALQSVMADANACTGFTLSDYERITQHGATIEDVLAYLKNVRIGTMNGNFIARAGQTAENIESTAARTANFTEKLEMFFSNVKTLLPTFAVTSFFIYLVVLCVAAVYGMYTSWREQETPTWILVIFGGLLSLVGLFFARLTANMITGILDILLSGKDFAEETRQRIEEMQEQASEAQASIGRIIEETQAFSRAQVILQTSSQEVLEPAALQLIRHTHERYAPIASPTWTGPTLDLLFSPIHWPAGMYDGVPGTGDRSLIPHFMKLASSTCVGAECICNSPFLAIAASSWFHGRGEAHRIQAIHTKWGRDAGGSWYCQSPYMTSRFYIAHRCQTTMDVLLRKNDAWVARCQDVLQNRLNSEFMANHLTKPDHECACHDPIIMRGLEAEIGSYNHECVAIPGALPASLKIEEVFSFQHEGQYVDPYEPRLLNDPDFRRSMHCFLRFQLHHTEEHEGCFCETRPLLRQRLAMPHRDEFFEAADANALPSEPTPGFQLGFAENVIKSIGTILSLPRTVIEHAVKLGLTWNSIKSAFDFFSFIGRAFPFLFGAFMLGNLPHLYDILILKTSTFYTRYSSWSDEISEFQKTPTDDRAHSINAGRKDLEEMLRRSINEPWHDRGRKYFDKRKAEFKHLEDAYVADIKSRRGFVYALAGKHGTGKTEVIEALAPYLAKIHMADDQFPASGVFWKGGGKFFEGIQDYHVVLGYKDFLTCADEDKAPSIAEICTIYDSGWKPNMAFGEKGIVTNVRCAVMATNQPYPDNPPGYTGDMTALYRRRSLLWYTDFTTPLVANETHAQKFAREVTAAGANAPNFPFMSYWLLDPHTTQNRDVSANTGDPDLPPYVPEEFREIVATAMETNVAEGRGPKHFDLKNMVNTTLRCARRQAENAATTKTAIKNAFAAIVEEPVGPPNRPPRAQPVDAQDKDLLKEILKLIAGAAVILSLGALFKTVALGFHQAAVDANYGGRETKLADQLKAKRKKPSSDKGNANASSAHEAISRYLRTNLVCVEAATMNIYGLLLNQETLLTNAHVFGVNKGEGMNLDLEMPETWNFRIARVVAPTESVQTTDHVADATNTVRIGSASNDAIVIKLSAPLVGVKDITHFVFNAKRNEEGHIDPEELFLGSALTRYDGSNCHGAYEGAVSILSYNQSTSIRAYDVGHYISNGGPGDCGAPVIATMNGEPRILGIHCGSKSKNNNYFMFTPRDALVSAMEMLGKPTPVNPVIKQVEFHDYSQFDFKPIRLPDAYEELTYAPIGEVKQHPNNPVLRTQLKPTPLRDAVPEYPCRVKPSEKSRKKIWEQEQKHGKHYNLMPGLLTQKAARWAKLRFKLPEKVVKKIPDHYTWDEVARHIEKDKSVGFGFNGFSRGDFMEGVGEESRFKPEFVEHLDALVAKMAAGEEVPLQVVLPKPKDESLNIEKIAAGKLRTFEVSQFDFFCIGVAFLGPVLDALHANYTATPSVVGFNMLGRSYHRVMKKLFYGKGRKKSVCLDYKAFESLVHWHYAKHFVEWLNESCQSTAAGNNVRFAYVYNCINSLMLIDDKIYLRCTGNPSGMVGTVDLNGFVNLIFQSAFFISVYPEASFSDFLNYYSCIVCGDDVVAVCESSLYEDVSFTKMRDFFARFDITITPANKDDKNPAEWCTSEEIEFCKTHPIWVDEFAGYVPFVSTHTLMDRASYCRDDTREGMLQLANSMLSFAVFHTQHPEEHDEIPPGEKSFEEIREYMRLLIHPEDESKLDTYDALIERYDATYHEGAQRVPFMNFEIKADANANFVTPCVVCRQFHKRPEYHGFEETLFGFVGERTGMATFADSVYKSFWNNCAERMILCDRMPMSFSKQTLPQLLEFAQEIEDLRSVCVHDGSPTNLPGSQDFWHIYEQKFESSQLPKSELTSYDSLLTICEMVGANPLERIRTGFEYENRLYLIDDWIEKLHDVGLIYWADFFLCADVNGNVQTTNVTNYGSGNATDIANDATSENTASVAAGTGGQTASMGSPPPPPAAPKRPANGYDVLQTAVDGLLRPAPVQTVTHRRAPSMHTNANANGVPVQERTPQQEQDEIERQAAEEERNPQTSVLEPVYSHGFEEGRVRRPVFRDNADMNANLNHQMMNLSIIDGPTSVPNMQAVRTAVFHTEDAAHEPETIATSDEEMTIEFFARRWSYFKTIDLLYSQNSGDVILTIDAQPGQCSKLLYRSLVAPSSVVDMTPLDFLLCTHRFWRGSIEFMFEVIAPREVAGKLMAVYVPGDYGATPPPMTQAVSMKHFDFDFDSTHRQFTFRVDQISISEWMQPYYTLLSNAAASGDEPAIGGSSYGRVYIYCVAKPFGTVATYTSSPQINFYIRGGPDFEVRQFQPIPAMTYYTPETLEVRTRRALQRAVKGNANSASPRSNPTPAPDTVETNLRKMAATWAVLDVVNVTTARAPGYTLLSKMHPSQTVTAQAQNAFNNARYYRGTLELRFTAMTTGVGGGQLICYYVPFRKVLDNPYSITRATQIEHVKLDLSSNVPAILRVPFISQLKYFTTEDIGRVFMQVMNKYQAPTTGNAGSLDVTIEARWVDLTLQVQQLRSAPVLDFEMADMNADTARETTTGKALDTNAMQRVSARPILEARHGGVPSGTFRKYILRPVRTDVNHLVLDLAYPNLVAPLRELFSTFGNASDPGIVSIIRQFYAFRVGGTYHDIGFRTTSGSLGVGLVSYATNKNAGRDPRISGNYSYVPAAISGVTPTRYLVDPAKTQTCSGVPVTVLPPSGRVRVYVPYISQFPLSCSASGTSVIADQNEAWLEVFNTTGGVTVGEFDYEVWSQPAADTVLSCWLGIPPMYFDQLFDGSGIINYPDVNFRLA